MKYKPNLSLLPLMMLPLPCSPNEFPSISCIISKYEMGKLYVGSLEDSFNKELLNDKEITKIIRVYDKPNSLDIFEDIEYVNIPIEDHPDADIQDYFDKTFKEIDKSLSIQENVLIHCRMGISRAPAIATAYLIRKLKTPSSDAIEMVTMARRCTDMNLGFILSLNDYAKDVLSE